MICGFVISGPGEGSQNDGPLLGPSVMQPLLFRVMMNPNRGGGMQ